MDSISAQVQTLAETADESTRNAILDSLRDLQCHLETPKDTFFRLFNSASSSFVVETASISSYPYAST